MPVTTSIQRHCAVVLSLTLVILSGSARAQPADALPNIVFIIADDLGWGEVGCYGQAKIRTPSIDRLAAEGMRFASFYSGSAVCAPSRCVLMTGLHTGHAYVRNNKEMGGWNEGDTEGQVPLPAGTVTLATLLREQGYATGAMGKWGLGGPGSTGMPEQQGFDLFYGYLCQRQAHNHYPTHLWRNGEKVVLEGNVWKNLVGPHYAHDLMVEEALAFVREHREQPFFLFMPFHIPHVALQVPDDSLVEYAGAFEETPYNADKGYLPHPTPRAAYAAMVTRMDRDIGRIVDLVDELGLGERTIVMFTSDNGPTYAGGADSEFFESAGPFRGLKGSLYEGGIRVPMIARWTGHVEPGTTTEHVSALWDVLPTVMDLTGGTTPDGLDGVSFAPILTGDDAAQGDHQALYWELGRQQAIRRGSWKLIRRWNRAGNIMVELFDLAADPAETTNLAAEQPALVARLIAGLGTARTPSPEFPLLIPTVMPKEPRPEAGEPVSLGSPQDAGSDGR